MFPRLEEDMYNKSTPLECKKMKMKQIIVVCIMAISVVVTHAQDVGNPSDNVVSTPQNEIKDPSSNVPLNPQNSIDNKKSNRNGVKKTPEVSNDNKKGADPSLYQSNPVNGMEHTGSQEKEDNGGFGGIESEDTQSVKAANVSNFYEETPPAKEQSDWGFIALIVAVLSLLVAGYNYITAPSKNNNKKGRHSRQQDQPNIERDILNRVNIVSRDLQSRITQLTSRVEDLESQLNRFSLGQPRNGKIAAHPENPFKSASRSEYSSNQNNSSISGTKLYASQVLSDCFPEEGLSDSNNDYAIAILSVKGDSGTFIINDRASAQSFLISNYAYGAGRVSDVNQQGDNPTRIETIQPGSIKRQANGWKIVANAQVKIV